jgi:S-adenosylmethionine hydrolase
MAPVITLTTDFGEAGPFVAVMKAVIMRYAPQAGIADLTHRIAPCQPGEAGFWLSRSYRYFPAGSVHVAVVDPGVGTTRAILACAWDGHVFLAPDNGILPMIAGAGTRVHALSAEWAARQDWPAPSHTFHGRDIFAPLAAALLTGRTRPGDIGPEASHLAPAAVPPPSQAQGMVKGQVVAVDTWGNLITNIEAALVAGLNDPRVGIGHRDLQLVTTYGAAPPGALFALVNSFGVVEIAWREGNAAQMLGLGRGTPVTVSATVLRS